MAMQLMIGVKKDKELVIDDTQKRVYYTESIKEICDELFRKCDFLEDDETVEYRIIEFEQIAGINERVDFKEDELTKKVKSTKGNEAKNELFSIMHDYMLLKTVIIKALFDKVAGKDIVIVLV